jgi:gamma-glutamylcyclotransferase (GGCT)/AIG2-like uncharacterized protein YtfP
MAEPADLVFFYGTLMTGFDRRRRAGVDAHLAEYLGRGWISAELYDLGLYPAAVPAPDGRVWGEVYRMKDPEQALAGLDNIEGFTSQDPDHSLYVREVVDVQLADGRTDKAWVFFYNAPLGRAERIPSGDYLAHVKVR